jgi:hypothetical protein
VVGVLFAVVVSGCSSDSPDTGPPSSSTADRPEVVKPVDRDAEAVMAALRRVDLCSVVRELSGAAEVEQRDPFSCTGSGVSVGVVDLPADRRLKMPVRDIGGAKAYVAQTSGDCVVYFPVSFEYAVEVEAGGCEPAVRLRLGTTARWDACGALGRALGNDTDLIEAGEYVGAACEPPAPEMAHLAFDSPLIGETTSVTVGGRAAEVQEDGDVCWTAWSDPPGLWTSVAANGCDTSKTLAESVMDVIATPPADGRPQDPLLYKPDDADTPYLGACANLEPRVAKYCRPYADTEVPDDAPLDADVDTQCAIARDAVTEHLGELVPVVVDDGENASCYFVEGERRVEVRFFVRSEPVAGIPDVFKVREALIAGHSAYVENGPEQDVYRVWVATSEDPRGDGTIGLTISAGPARREGQPIAGDEADLVIGDVLAAYFS